MSRFPELSSLFAALASNLQDQTAGDEVDMSVSNLSRSLNLSEAPRVRILDTALSLMCFTAPQVYDSVIEFNLKTITTVLSSSIECKVLRTDNEQVLRVGGLISKSDCVNVVEGCADVLGKMDGHKGDHCALLLYNVIRVAALAPCFPRAITSISKIEMKSRNCSSSVLGSLVGHLSNETTFKNGQIPVRLLLWHLDPMILKQDVSQILQEIIKRPFLSLSTEMYNKIEWRSKLICLVMSPSMFIETRAFLHNWFLMTGLASVIELQIEFVEQVLDIISRPMWWGISMEVGSKLPFSHAYFPYEHHLLRILAGPLSQEYFQHLLHKISGSVSHAVDHFHTSSRTAARKINLVDHKSLWSLVMNFPCWFFFASMLLFCDNSPTDSSICGSTLGSVKPRLMHDSEVTNLTRAAKFIAWILNPMSESDRQHTVDYLVKVSESWTLKYSSPNKYNNITRVHNQSRRLKLHDKDGISSQELDSRVVSLWLMEFKDMYTDLFGAKVGFSIHSAKGYTIHQNILLRRIPLGILLVHHNHLSASGCSLLLHYAATGSVQKFSDTQSSGQSQQRRKYDRREDSMMTWTEQYTKGEAIAGCRTVFDTMDVTENISPSLFETEEEVLNFIRPLKLKTCSYLLKCIGRLLQIELDEDSFHLRRDLLARVIRWRHQGKDAYQNKDLDYVCDALKV